MSRKMKITIPVLAATLFLQGCSGNSNEKDKAEVTVDVPTNESSDEDDFILPQPITLAQTFQSAGLTYQKGKTNPVANADKYVQNIDRLLNLGVYSADLAYCAINNKTQEAREYLIAIQT
jgi:PBP1b-binding outer membrane lipoprotein LpoB